jgi:hypothetical protein
VPLPDEDRQRHDRERDDCKRETSHGDLHVSLASALGTAPAWTPVLQPGPQMIPGTRHRQLGGVTLGRTCSTEPDEPRAVSDARRSTRIIARLPGLSGSSKGVAGLGGSKMPSRPVGGIVAGWPSFSWQ